MTTYYSTTEQLAAMAAAAGAADGGKAAAFLGSWQTALGSNPKLVLYRNEVSVWEGAISGDVPISGSAFVIETGSQSSISTADIDTGVWQFRVENAANAAIFLGVDVTLAGGTNILSLDGDLAPGDTVDIGTITLHAPALDTVQPVIEQAGSLVKGTNVGSLTLTLSTQPTDGNKILVPFSYYEGFRGYSEPTDVTVGVFLDPSDFSTLRTNTDGTGAVSSVGTLVKRINNKGSAGGHLSSSAGWYLRQAANGAYYLEMSGSTEFASSFAASSVIGSAAGEVIAACRPTATSGGGDSWYAGPVWQAGDGRAGVTIHGDTAARAYNRVATDTYHALTHAMDADQVFSWQHSSGYVTGAVGFASTYPAGTASGDTTNLTTPFAIGGTYHGSFPRLTGRFYGLVAKSTVFTQTERDFIQWYLSRKMSPTSSLPDPIVTDNAGNAYTLVNSRSDASYGNRLKTGLLACHTVEAGDGTFTATLSVGGGSKGYCIAAQLVEVSGLVGSTAVDGSGSNAEDGSDGSMSATTGSTVQDVELVVSTFGLHNADTDANITTPSGYTSLGVNDDAAAEVGYEAAYKVVTATGTQSATQTWDADSAGGAALTVTTFRAGVNQDAPSGGGGQTELTLNGMASDVNTSLAHEFLMDGVNPDWSWGTYPRAGTGANPPSATGWTSPAWVPWGHCATKRSDPPGTHNWRLAVFAIYHAEKRGGQWQFTGTQVTSASQIDGSMYTNYETNSSTAANKRTANGFLEIKFPNDGGSYHWFPTFRTPISASGAQHRAVLLKLALTLDDQFGTDDRAGAEVCALAGGDYWKSMSQGWDPAVYSNDDFWIARATKPALYPSHSWHTAHTMTAEGDISEFIAWIDSQGVLD